MQPRLRSICVTCLSVLALNSWKRLSSPMKYCVCNLSFVYVINWVHSPAATIAMKSIKEALDSALKNLSDESYEKSSAYFRLWAEIAQTHSQIPSGLILDTISMHRTEGALDDKSIHSTTRLILRLVDDVESDSTLALHNTGLKSRFCARILQEFFDEDLSIVHSSSGRPWHNFYVDVNLIAHCANLGYIEEHTIRNHILQSLIYHPKVYDHQVNALAILFKIAGATFGAYVDSAVVDRCLELLKNHQFQSKTQGAPIQVSILSEGMLKELRQNSRRQLSYGSVAGKVSLLLHSQPGNKNRLVRARRTPAQLRLPHLWDSLRKTSNLRFITPLHQNPSPPQRQTPFTHPSSLSLHPSASPLYPTSRSQMLLVTSLLSTPQP